MRFKRRLEVILILLILNSGYSKLAIVDAEKGEEEEEVVAQGGGVGGGFAEQAYQQAGRNNVNNNANFTFPYDYNRETQEVKKEKINLLFIVCDQVRT